MRTITEGTMAPDFELPDQDGTLVRLSSLLTDGPVVLFFYPAAMSPGCSSEACHFRDLAGEFAAVGARRVGISPDPVAKQRKFAEGSSLDYPLLSDPEGDVALAYGVKKRFITPVKRVTLVIGTDQRIQRVISGEFNMTVHADEALKVLQRKAA